MNFEGLILSQQTLADIGYLHKTGCVWNKTIDALMSSTVRQYRINPVLRLLNGGLDDAAGRS